jgi:hypothetical protein
MNTIENENRNEYINALLEEIDSDWLDPCEIRGHHWAYADDAQRADDFGRRLHSAEPEELEALQDEERASVEANCEEAKELIRRALLEPDQAEELIGDAFSLWGVYGDAAPLYEIRDILLKTEE